MERIPRGIYTKELREEAVKLVTDRRRAKCTGGGAQIINCPFNNKILGEGLKHLMK